MNLSDYGRFQKQKDGIPKYPLYGYDNANAIDSDWDYFKASYPLAVRQLQKEVEEECDKLEYDGSCMFDHLPDHHELNAIINKIYETMTSKGPAFQSLETEAISPERCFGHFCPPPKPGHCGPGRPCPPPRPCGPGRNCRPPRPDYRQDGQPDWMRDLVAVLLSNEMLHRRRRYRNRKQWF